MPSTLRLWRAHGQPNLHCTHRLAPAALIDTADLFPGRTWPVTFHARIRITENAGTHQGIVFEFGSSSRAAVVWVEDERIGFHAGEAGTAGGADAIYDHGAELPPGWMVDIVAAALPATGQVWLALNRRVIRGAATNGTFASTWAAIEDGSFAAAVQGTTVAVVPAGSWVAPDGFSVVSKLSVYKGQIPRLFL